MIHVCFGLYDKTGRYSKFTGTAMLSLFDNTTSEVTVHILHDNTLTQDNRDKFSYLAGRYGQHVKFYNVEQLCADKISEMINLVPAVKTARVSVGAFYRLLIPQLLPDDIDKCIYLDSDIIVNLDINELWRIELGDKPLAVITEISNGVNSGNWFDLCIEGFVKAEDYFNSGIMLMNLKFLRGVKEQIQAGIRFRGEHPNYRFFDQAVWNYCFSSQTLKLPTVFNRFVRYARRENESVTKKIYHYTVNSIYLDSVDVFNRLWMSYFIKTPFFDEETIGRIYAGVQSLHDELKQAMINISAMMSGKTRAFFTLPHNVEATKAIFSVRDNEDIILADNPESLQKLIDTMKLSERKKVFFIILPNFPLNLLIQEGFVYGKDFVNGLEFLSEAQGLPLNSYSFVQAM